MNNRGSKSVSRSYSAIVKEQRVNGCRYLQDFCNIFKMYSNELRNKLWLSFYRKIYYDSALIGLNSLNINTRRYYATLSNNKHIIDDL